MSGYKDIQVDKLKNVFVRYCSGEKQATADHAFLQLTFLKAKRRKGKLPTRLCGKSFSGKSKFVEEECLLLQDEHISFCVFTFRVDCEMYSLSIWKFSLRKVLSFGTIVVHSR